MNQTTPATAPDASTLRGWLRPFWSGRSVVDDPLFFVQDEGGDPVADLLFEPRGRLTLRSADGRVEYREGTDFRREGRRLHLLPATRVPFKTRAQLLLPPGAPQSIGASTDGKHHLFFSEGHVWHDLQAAASYPHRGGWDFPLPKSSARALPRTRRILREGRPLRFTALGDSITAGGNASLRTGAPPFMPAWSELSAWGITDRTRAKVECANLAVGGMSSPWGVERVEACIATAPDIMAIAFGMNDASGRRPVAEFAGNIERIVRGVRAKLPDCEFVLVAGMTGNPEWTASAPALYPAYRDAMRSLEGPGVAVADVTAAWDALCARKKWRDFTGNGVNHPNDFGHRVYAQVFLATLGIA